MMWMFSGCSSLVSLDLSGFDTSSVTDMRSMFYGCSSLSSLDLSCFDTSSVTNMMCMFDGCSEYIRNKYRYLERR
jgi:surface protein